MSEQEQPSVVVEEQPVVVEEQPVVVEEQPVVENVLTDEEVLLNFGLVKSSQSLLIRRGAVTILSNNGITDPTEKEINDTICNLYRKHKNWDDLLEIDAAFYR